jgi:hypothetical protein
MSLDIDRKNALHGAVIAAIGLLIFFKGPIEFKGALVDNFAGIIVSICGVAIILASVL